MLGDGDGRRSVDRLPVTAHSDGDGASVVLGARRTQPSTRTGGDRTDCGHCFRPCAPGVLSRASASRWPSYLHPRGRSCGRAAVCAEVPYARPVAQLVEDGERSRPRHARIEGLGYPHRTAGMDSPTARRLAAAAPVRDQWRRVAPTPGSRHSIPRRRSRASRRRDRARAQGPTPVRRLLGCPAAMKDTSRERALFAGAARVEERLPRLA